MVCGGGRTLVELLERERLRLGDEEQDEHEPDDVPCGVPPEGAFWLERDDEVAAAPSASEQVGERGEI